MKKLSRLSLLAVSTLALVGCATQQAESKEWKPSMPESTESQAPVSSEADSYVEPSYPAEEAPSYSLPKQPKPEEPEPYNPVWQGFEAEDPIIEVVTEEELSIQSVAEQLVANCWEGVLTLEECYDNELIYIHPSADWIYVVLCNWGAGTQADIASVTSYVGNYCIPEGLELIYQPGASTLSGADYAYKSFYATEVANDAICISETDYLASGKMYSQFLVGYLDDFLTLG